MILGIRKRISQEEFDYQMLLDCLKQYSRPRDKISDLIRKENIVRIKKGIYIFGEEYRRQSYSKEILANLIYGPSYISLDSALQFYGLIPEQVEAITSVTTGRSRKFMTPVGLFTFRRIPMQAFRIGMDRVEIDNGRSFLMAEPEKALADKVYDERGLGIETQKEMADYLENNLRVDLEAVRNLNQEYLHEIGKRYRSRKIEILVKLIVRMHRRRKDPVYA